MSGAPALKVVLDQNGLAAIEHHDVPHTHPKGHRLMVHGHPNASSGNREQFQVYLRAEPGAPSASHGEAGGYDPVDFEQVKHCRKLVTHSRTIASASRTDPTAGAPDPRDGSAHIRGAGRVILLGRILIPVHHVVW